MSLAGSNYDPEEDEGRKRSAHITGKELRIYGIALIIAVILLTPVYFYLMDLRNSHVCRQNLHEIANAIEGYCDDNNDRYPPLYVTSDTGNEPKVFANGEVSTWVSLLSTYTPKPSVFECPAATAEEGVKNADTKGNIIVSDYGMYAPLSTEARGNIADSQNMVLIADSSNDGSNGTYDPLPLKTDKGQIVPDGMSIGLNTTNITLSDSNLDTAPTQTKPISKATAVTRVSIKPLGPEDKSNDIFGPKSRSRHPEGVNVLMADLHLDHVTGPDLNVAHLGKTGAITGFWSTQ